MLKLNLGCGQNPLPGYVNVDKFGEPDIRWDLETFPWPWEDNSVEEIFIGHVLEHLGATTEIYFNIIKELYRISKPDATIEIVVPHPRHDDFLNDPTHVRVITPDSLILFSKTKNREWVGKATNSPLGLYLDVDFHLANVNYFLDDPWRSRYAQGEIQESEIQQAIKQFNNVVKQIEITLKVVKDGP